MVPRVFVSSLISYHLAMTTRSFKGVIKSKLKHAIKHKTSPAKLAQLFQSWTVRRHCLQAKTKC